MQMYKLFCVKPLEDSDGDSASFTSPATGLINSQPLLPALHQSESFLYKSASNSSVLSVSAGLKSNASFYKSQRGPIAPKPRQYEMKATPALGPSCFLSSQNLSFDVVTEIKDVQQLDTLCQNLTNESDMASLRNRTTTQLYPELFSAAGSAPSPQKALNEARGERALKSSSSCQMQFFSLQEKIKLGRERVAAQFQRLKEMESILQSYEVRIWEVQTETSLIRKKTEARLRARRAF